MRVLNAIRAIGGAIKKGVYMVTNAIKKCGEFVKNTVKRLVPIFVEAAVIMMETVIQKLANRVSGNILGAAHIYRLVNGIYQEGTKNYSVNEEIGEWNETIVTRPIPIESIPPKYRNLDEGNEINDTQDIHEEMVYRNVF